MYVWNHQCYTFPELGWLGSSVANGPESSIHLNSSISILWESIKDADSWTHYRPTDSEALRMGPKLPSRGLLFYGLIFRFRNYHQSPEADNKGAQLKSGVSILGPTPPTPGRDQRSRVYTPELDEFWHQCFPMAWFRNPWTLTQMREIYLPT